MTLSSGIIIINQAHSVIIFVVICYELNCEPPNSYVKVRISNILECELICKQSHWRCNWIVLFEMVVFFFICWQKWKLQGSFLLLNVFLMESKQKNILWTVKSEQIVVIRIMCHFTAWTFSRILVVGDKKSEIMSQRDSEQEQKPNK